MDLFLAGATTTGSIRPLWMGLAEAERSGNMDVYLAGTQGRRWCVDELFSQANDANKESNLADISILESFYYADEWTEWAIPRISKFLLDSGAFTFFSSGKQIDWDEYLTKYINFINKNDVKLFFELDIDPLVGYENVLKIRKRLEAETGKKCIPVWHKSRGKDEFLKMCDKYEYVALGGIVSKEITRNEYKYFPWFINEAHKRGAKIHGLGFTSMSGLAKYHFDSVDSSSWTTGNRFGFISMFDGKTIKTYDKPKGQSFKSSQAVAINNFNEWVKFQRYAKSHL